MKQECLIAEFMNSVIIFTPPRTGRNFLQMGFNHCTQFWIETNNSDSNLDLSNFEYVLSIARDPKESVASLSTMIKEKEGVSLLQDIQSAMNKYNDFMRAIQNNNLIIYKYDDLVNKTDKLFSDIAQRLNVKINKKYDYFEMLDIMLDFEKNNIHGYKKTFTNEPRYQDVLKIINSLDFTESYALYNDAISRSVEL